MSCSEPTPIAIAVVRQGDRFLIGQRPASVALANYWEFPGGKVEPGETPPAAAVRECLEETGLHVRVLFAYPEHVQQYDHGRVRLFFFACEPQQPAENPIAPYRWVQRDELSTYEFPAGNRRLVEILLGNREE